MDNIEDSNPMNSEPSEQEEEFNHSDKMIGIFTEPIKTFEKIAEKPPKTIDWLLPAFLLFAVICITQVLINTNSGLHSQVVEIQMTKIQKNLDQAVKDGKISQGQAEEQLSAMQERMGTYGGLQIVFTILGVFIGGFIVFFIIAGIYYLFVKFLLKGDGNYQSVLVASGMTFYIAILGVIITTILTFAMGKFLADTSLASFLSSDKSTIAGFIFAKLDIFSIWGYIILSIGLAKLFKSASTAKYYATVFGIWILGSLLLFGIARAVPFLRYFGA